MSRESWLIGAVGALLAINLSLGGCAVSRGQDPLWLQEKIENARTKADHEELAEYYEQEAKTLRSKAEQHDRMALAVGLPMSSERWRYDFGRHCKYLAARYREAAEGNLALAKLHRRMAAELQ